MKKFLNIALIVGVSSGVIYLGIGYGLSLFSTVEKPSGQEECIAFDKLRNNEQNLSVPSLEGYQTRDGTDQYYRYYESEADKVVILVHGSGYHSKYLASLANYLSGEGVATVYTPDLRGHGPNTENRGDIDYIGQIEEDLNDLISLVVDRHPDSSIIVGGHSSGGGAVIRMAGGSSHHEAVDGYLLLAPYIHHDAPTNAEDSNWANVNLQRMIGLSMLNQIGITHMNHLDAISFNMPNDVRDNTETLAYSYRLQISMHPRDEYEEDIESMDNRVFVLIGREDQTFQANQYEEVFHNNENAKIRMMEDATHFGVVLDEKAHRIIAEWLEQ
ncbi:alpha/beta hydrolase [Halobacillus sp. B29]|uniref:alpha/beta hydrolase n=1 Tax=Halobacillus sp. B29 TaxID=3457432 RepID=UPI003FCE9CBF